MQKTTTPKNTHNSKKRKKRKEQKKKAFSISSCVHFHKAAKVENVTEYVSNKLVTSHKRHM